MAKQSRHLPSTAPYIARPPEYTPPPSFYSPPPRKAYGSGDTRLRKRLTTMKMNKRDALLAAIHRHPSTTKNGVTIPWNLIDIAIWAGVDPPAANKLFMDPDPEVGGVLRATAISGNVAIPSRGKTPTWAQMIPNYERVLKTSDTGQAQEAIIAEGLASAGRKPDQGIREEEERLINAAARLARARPRMMIQRFREAFVPVDSLAAAANSYKTDVTRLTSLNQRLEDRLELLDERFSRLEAAAKVITSKAS